MAPEPQRTAKPVWQRVALVSIRVLPVLLLGVGLYKADLSHFRVRDTAVGPLLLAIALNLSGATLIKVWRWRIALTDPPSVLQTVFAGLEGVFISLASGFGLGDAVRTARLRGHLKNFAQDFGASLAERAAEFLGLALLIVAAVIAGVASRGWLLLGGAMVVGYVALMTLGWRLLPYVQRLRRWPKIAIAMHGLLAASTARRAVLMTVCTLCNWVVEMGVLMLAFRAFHLPGNAGVALGVVIGINLAMLIPSAPMGLGVFEGGVVAALKLQGFDESVALAFAVSYHAMMAVPSVLVGGLVYGVRDLLRKRGRAT